MVYLNIPLPIACNEGDNNCPCFDSESMECKAIVPHKYIFEDGLHTEKPEWCPLNKTVNPIGKDETHWYCGSCGSRLPLKIRPRFCHKCGIKIGEWKMREKNVRVDA